MGIYYDPPQPNVGNKQPLEQKKLVPPQAGPAVNNPPLRSLQAALVATMAIWAAATAADFPPHIGAAQPLQAKRLTPPISGPGAPCATTHNLYSILSTWDAATAADFPRHIGNQQPLQAKRLVPPISGPAPQTPPLTGGSKTNLTTILAAWTPVDQPAQTQRFSIIAPVAQPPPPGQQSWPAYAWFAQAPTYVLLGPLGIPIAAPTNPPLVGLGRLPAILGVWDAAAAANFNLSLDEQPYAPNLLIPPSGPTPQNPPVIGGEPEHLTATQVAWLPPDPAPQWGPKLTPSGPAAQNPPLIDRWAGQFQATLNDWLPPDPAPQWGPKVTPSGPTPQAPPVIGGLPALPSILATWTPPDPAPQYGPKLTSSAPTPPPLVGGARALPALLAAWMPPDPAPQWGPKFTPSGPTPQAPPLAGRGTLASVLSTWTPSDPAPQFGPKIVPQPTAAAYLSPSNPWLQTVLATWAAPDPLPQGGPKLTASGPAASQVIPPGEQQWPAYAWFAQAPAYVVLGPNLTASAPPAPQLSANSWLPIVLASWTPADPAPQWGPKLTPSGPAPQRPPIIGANQQSVYSWFAQPALGIDLYGPSAPNPQSPPVIGGSLAALQTILAAWIPPDPLPQLGTRQFTPSAPPKLSVSNVGQFAAIIASWAPPDPAPQFGPKLTASGPATSQVIPPGEQQWPAFAWFAQDPAYVLLGPSGLPVSAPPTPVLAANPWLPGVLTTWGSPDPAPQSGPKLTSSGPAAQNPPLIGARIPIAVLNSWLPADPLPQLGTKVFTPSAPQPTPVGSRVPDAILNAWLPPDPLPQFGPKLVPQANPPLIGGSAQFQAVLTTWLPPEPAPQLGTRVFTPSGISNPPLIGGSGQLPAILAAWIPPDPAPQWGVKWFTPSAPPLQPVSGAGQLAAFLTAWLPPDPAPIVGPKFTPSGPTPQNPPLIGGRLSLPTVLATWTPPDPMFEIATLGIPQSAPPPPPPAPPTPPIVLPPVVPPIVLEIPPSGGGGPKYPLKPGEGGPEFFRHAHGGFDFEDFPSSVIEAREIAPRGTVHSPGVKVVYKARVIAITAIDRSSEVGVHSIKMRYRLAFDAIPPTVQGKGPMVRNHTQDIMDILDRIMPLIKSRFGDNG